jgi:C1A family cysteine protease
VGGGRFIFRNSWGLDFAKSSIRFGAGYGSIPYSYVTTYGKEAYSIH